MLYYALETFIIIMLHTLKYHSTKPGTRGFISSTRYSVWAISVHYVQKPVQIDNRKDCINHGVLCEFATDWHPTVTKRMFTFTMNFRQWYINIILYIKKHNRCYCHRLKIITDYSKHKDINGATMDILFLKVKTRNANNAWETAAISNA